MRRKTARDKDEKGAAGRRGRAGTPSPFPPRGGHVRAVFFSTALHLLLYCAYADGDGRRLRVRARPLSNGPRRAAKPIHIV
ncbi:hypothetical protein PR202_ga27239 [Eleusine coracana subsp. coracana]|uniref:Uncharacterized protein n=1 Tax=Eleusine coracana subsp. coracana TaxID=191504 RepID=A0AAV5DH57_ELECO|nr:hypothetical protein PR202_ga27239 [Eleusine coracana subsp. coracana]